MVVSSALVVAGLAVWAGAAVWLSVVDLRTRTLPTRVIWGTAAVVWILYVAAALVEGTPEGLMWAAVGAAACAGFLAVVHFIDPRSLGFGDVRLAALNGLLCGWWGWRAALFGLGAGFLVALPEALVTLFRHGPRAARPLGPYLVIGAAAIAVWQAATQGLVPFA